jgi:hypothetical protein
MKVILEESRCAICPSGWVNIDGQDQHAIRWRASNDGDNVHLYTRGNVRGVIVAKSEEEIREAVKQLLERIAV